MTRGPTFYLIVRGPLGVGKTTVARALAARLGGQVLSVDEALEVPGMPAWDGGSLRLFLATNPLLADRATTLLRRGVPVLFDGNFYWEKQLKDLEDRLPYPHRVITLDAPLSVCTARDAGREAPYGREAAAQVFRKVQRVAPRLSIDATRGLPEIVRAILDQVPFSRPAPESSKATARGARTP